MITIPNLPGSVEKFLESIRDAVATKYFGGKEYGPWHLVSSFSDHALVSVKVDMDSGKWETDYDDYPDSRKKKNCERKIFQINFTSDAKGNVTLKDEDPEEIEFSYGVVEEGIPTIEALVNEDITREQYFKSFTNILNEAMAGSILVGRAYPRRKAEDKSRGKSEKPKMTNNVSKFIVKAQKNTA